MAAVALAEAAITVIMPQDEYSDYGVCGVFLSQNRLDEMADGFPSTL